MEPVPHQVEYLSVRGYSPFEEWFRSLKDSKTRAIVRFRIDRLGFGLFGNCREVGGGVWELKIDFGPGIRVYYSIVGKRIVLLITGGDKRKQKADIKKAKELFYEWTSSQNK